MNFSKKNKVIIFVIISIIFFIIILFGKKQEKIISVVETQITEPPKPPVVLPPLTYSVSYPKKTQQTLQPQKKILDLRTEYNNEDVIGYLNIAGTSIDYPVLQSTDNEYYLLRNINHVRTISASIFLDFENDISRKDRNTVIYGHNMNSNFMFHALRFFKDIEFYNSHKYITFDTLYGNQTWEIFSFYKTNTKFEYIKVFFQDDEDFLKTLNEMKQKSLYDTDVEVSAKDLILTLSTCSNQEEDTRLVVNAKLINQTYYTTESEFPYNQNNY